jgi:hypothetical protein
MWLLPFTVALVIVFIFHVACSVFYFWCSFLIILSFLTEFAWKVHWLGLTNRKHLAGAEWAAEESSKVIESQERGLGGSR